MRVKRVLIVAGEASGDLHAATLIQQSKAINPYIHFVGIGGDNMRQAGANILIDINELSVVGLVEVLTHFKAIKNAMRKMRWLMKHRKPDLVVLIDYSGVNLRLAKSAHKLGIPVLYYISPQVWAWRKYRVKTIQRVVDHMAVIYPFEVKFYQSRNVDVSYVENPLVHQVLPSLSKAQAMQQFGLDETNPIIGILPGSRKGEIERMMPTLVESAIKLQAHYPNAQFVIPIAGTIKPAQLTPYFEKYNLNIKIIPKQLYNLMQCCDAAVTVSGTVTLELALLAVPMVILYIMAPMTFSIVRHIIKIPHIGLCNLIAEKRMVPELIQHQANPEAISQEVIKIMADESYRESMLQNFADLKTSMLQNKHKQRIGDIVIDMLQLKPTEQTYEYQELRSQ